jgi:Fe-Mn family superoxide dismutase
MIFELPPLPYKDSALAPALSARAVKMHHSGHLKGYIDALNAIPEIRQAPEMRLEQLLIQAAKHRDFGERPAGILPAEGLMNDEVYNLAAQIYNHSFFFQCLKPKKSGGGGEPRDKMVLTMLEEEFGGWKAFRDVFTNRCMDLFGSGWVWLAADEDRIEVIVGQNAETPFVYGLAPILVLDMWEHAYYLDYQKDKKKYVDAFFDEIVNWEFAAHRLNSI